MYRDGRKRKARNSDSNKAKVKKSRCDWHRDLFAEQGKGVFPSVAVHHCCRPLLFVCKHNIQNTPV